MSETRKKIDRNSPWLKASAMALLPILCCGVFLIFSGKSLFDVNIAASEWNDELFYFKQTEGILLNGYPLGYFGFNESHALTLSYAAWSPVLLLPWLLWGFCFGWNALSPILCNLVVYVVTLFLASLLVKPSWKQIGVFAVFFASFTLNVRYVFSAMPEITCFSLLILFYALAIGYEKEEKMWKLVCMFVLAVLMTWMRPYLLLMLFLPMIYLFLRNHDKKHRIIACLVSLVILGITAVVYWAINHYLAAEYFAPLFNTDWVKSFFDQGLFGGIRFTLGTLFYKSKDFVSHMVGGMTQDRASGLFFIMYLISMALLLWQNLGKEKKEHKLVRWHLFGSFFAMLMAILLMYKLTEGSKHLLTFIAAGLFFLAMTETKYIARPIITTLCLLFLFGVKTTSEYDFAVPFTSPELDARQEYWSAQFAENMEFDTAHVPGYENTVIWTFSDEVDGEWILTDWQLLYELPAGYGISCCYQDYVLANLDTLQCRYLSVAAGGKIDELCREKGWTEVGRDSALVVYRK
jgi:hypothetical protein